MVFMEEEDLDAHFEKIEALNLPQKYKGVKLSKITYND